MSFIILVKRGVKYFSGPLQPSKLNENIKFSDTSTMPLPSPL